jgi:hypothetical protein
MSDELPEFQRRIDAWIAQRWQVKVDPGSGSIAMDAAGYSSGAWCRIGVYWKSDGKHGATDLEDNAWQYEFGQMIREIVEVEI